MPTEICRHIKTNGARCGSPAVTGSVFCYFHRNLGLNHSRPKPQKDDIQTIIHPMLPDAAGQRDPLIAEYYSEPFGTLHLPALEDRESIQVAISMLVGALAANRIEPARASTLLYGLQVASANAAKLSFAPSRSEIVRETVLTPNGEEIAPDEDSEAEISYQQYMSCVLDGNCTCGEQDDEADDEDNP